MALSLITQISYSTDLINFTKIDFIFSTAAYFENCKKTAQGNIFEHELCFSSSLITSQTVKMINRLRISKCIAFTDINNTTISISRGELLFKVEYKKSISAKPGDFRGYDVTIKFNTPRSII